MTSGKARFALIASIALLTTGLAGCAAPDGEGAIRIGTILPLTGDLDTFGPDMERAVQMAISDVNQAGGLLGSRQVEHVSGDSRTDEAQAPQEFQRLVQEGVAGVVGAASSGVTGSILGSAVDNEIMLVSPASTSPALTDRDNDGFFYRVPPNDALQGKVMAELLADENVTRAATLYVNNDYGQGFDEVLFNEFTSQLSGIIQNRVAYDPKATSFQSEIQQANQGDPDAIVFIGYPDTGTTIMRQAHEMGVLEGTDIYFSEGVFSESFVDDVGQDQEGDYILEGFQGTTPQILLGGEEGGVASSFIDRFEQEYGHEPGLFAAQSYDAAMSIMLAIQASGSTDAADYKDAMLDVWNSPGEKVSAQDIGKGLRTLGDGGEIDYQGVSGDFEWNEDGDPVRGIYAIWQVQDDGSIAVSDRGIEKSL